MAMFNLLVMVVVTCAVGIAAIAGLALLLVDHVRSVPVTVPIRTPKETLDA